MTNKNQSGDGVVNAAFHTENETPNSKGSVKTIKFDERTIQTKLKLKMLRKIPVVKENYPLELDEQPNATVFIWDKPWPEYTKFEKIMFVILSIFKVLVFILLLYIFIVSLTFVTIGFTLVAPLALSWGPSIKFILTNPFTACALGLIVTALMQNGTATTSIVISMVGAGIIPDTQSAVYILIGINMGSCVTNSLIALTYKANADQFKLAFTSATMNDMFNLLTVTLLMIVEICSHFLNIVSGQITNLINFSNSDAIAQANFIGFIINPLVNVFIVLNGTAVDAVVRGDTTITQQALYCCGDLNNVTANGSVQSVDCTQTCSYWCIPMLKAFGEAGTGLFWIIFSVIILLASIFSIVEVFGLLIVGPIAKGVRRAVSASLPGRMKWFTEVILFIVSLFITLIIQSSNIILATLVPLCSLGIIGLDRNYVITVGANIGTTITGIISAFTLTPAAMQKGLQIAFVYTLFNVVGVILWLPIPFMRLPKFLALKLGEIVQKYLWFLYFYVVMLYFIAPAIMFGLALVPYWIGMALVGGFIIILIIFFCIITLLRKFMFNRLPTKLQSFDWLPQWMRSLEPYDNLFPKIKCCKDKNENEPGDENSSVVDPNEIELEAPGSRRNSRRKSSQGQNSLINEGGVLSFFKRVNTLDGLVREAERKASAIEAERRTSRLSLSKAQVEQMQILFEEGDDKIEDENSLDEQVIKHAKEKVKEEENEDIKEEVGEEEIRI